MHFLEHHDLLLTSSFANCETLLVLFPFLSLCLAQHSRVHNAAGGTPEVAPLMLAPGFHALE